MMAVRVRVMISNFRVKKIMSNERFNLRVSAHDLKVLSDALNALAQHHHKAFNDFCYRFNTQPKETARLEMESEEWKSLKRDNECLGRLMNQIEYQSGLGKSNIKFGGFR